MSTTSHDPLFDVLTQAQTLLDDQANADNPMRSIVSRLMAAIGTLEKRLDKISVISDHYQAQLKEMNERLGEIAHTDLLTGLPNRRDMLERLKSEISRAQRSNQVFSVLEIDIDHFKHVNDNYGHIVGDQILASIAELMQTSLRSCDTCARWGGEEFLVLLPDTDSNGARVIAERLRQEIAGYTFKSHEQSLNKTISIGGMCYRSIQTLDELLQITDNMLYQAKISGRNCVRFAEEADNLLDEL